MNLQKVNDRIWMSFFLVVIAWSLIGCATSQDQMSNTETKQAPPVSVAPNPNVLRVGISTNAPPLIFKQGTEIVGLEAELAKKFGDYLDRSIAFIELDWEDQIPALLANKTDIIMSGMSITKMRQVRIEFSRPYFRTGQMALTSNKYLKMIPQGYYGIRGMSILSKFGVVKGTVGETFVQQNFGQAKKIVPYKTSEQAVGDLLKGRIDLFIHDGPIIFMLAAENETKGLAKVPFLLSEEYLAWGIRKNDVELLEAANNFVDMMIREDKLDPIINRWIPFKY
ncbi:MAG: transporter substrate-binding domain-containing protein [Desulfobacterales bacterium]